MMGKLQTLAGVAIGYVLGARAGRPRYDEIVDKANSFWGNPKVQEKVQDVKDGAPQVASAAGSKIADAAKDAAGTVKDKVTKSDEEKLADDLKDAKYDAKDAFGTAKHDAKDAFGDNKNDVQYHFDTAREDAKDATRSTFEK